MHPTSGCRWRKSQPASTNLGLRSQWRDAEGAALFQPARALVAQQSAANLSGIVARRDADDLETLGMLVAAEPVAKKGAHAVGDGLRVRAAVELENGVHALAEFGIGQADHDGRAHAGVLANGGLDLGRIDVGAAAQDHVGEAIAEIEIAFRVEPSDIAERFPAVRAPLRL